MRATSPRTASRLGATVRAAAVGDRVPDTGLGYLLAQQLVSAGECVVDVPATLSSRARVLGSDRSNTNDPNEARAVAIVGLRALALAVVRREDHVMVLRLLAGCNANAEWVEDGRARFRDGGDGVRWLIMCGVALVAAGHDVRALTRRPEAYRGPGVAFGGDIGDRSALGSALEGCDGAYYLVHSLDSPDFVGKDRRSADAFGDAATNAGVGQVIYLGGLGDDADQLSAHLLSRREVEDVLRARVPTTVLRAGIVIGDGGISWEILRQLVARLPVMVTPRWVKTRTQPVAIDDAVAFLIGVLGHEETLGEVYEIGGPESMTYEQMLKVVGRMPGGILKLIVPVPLLSPRLSSHWLRLITDVDLHTARTLVESMSNEVVVHDRRIEALTGHHAMNFQQAAERALHARQERLESVAAA